MSQIDQEGCSEDTNLKTLVDQGDFDNHIYDSVNKYEGYLPSLHFIDDPLDDDDGHISGVHSNFSTVLGATSFPKKNDADTLFDQFEQRKVRNCILIHAVIINKNLYVYRSSQYSNLLIY